MNLYDKMNKPALTTNFAPSVGRQPMSAPQPSVGGASALNSGGNDIMSMMPMMMSMFGGGQSSGQENPIIQMNGGTKQPPLPAPSIQPRNYGEMIKKMMSGGGMM